MNDLARELLKVAAELVSADAGKLFRSVLEAVSDDAPPEFSIGFDADRGDPSSGSPGGVSEVWLDNDSDDMRISWKDVERHGGSRDESALKNLRGEAVLDVYTDYGRMRFPVKFRVLRVGGSGVVVRVWPQLGRREMKELERAIVR